MTMIIIFLAIIGTPFLAANMSAAFYDRPM